MRKNLEEEKVLCSTSWGYYCASRIQYETKESINHYY